MILQNFFYKNLEKLLNFTNIFVDFFEIIKYKIN